jgi:5-methylcytosine-specific restriction endonuclease McrBC regulatory subunit McrC
VNSGRFTLSWGSFGPSQRIMLLEAFESVPIFLSAQEALAALRETTTDRMNWGYREALKLAELILTGLDVAGTWASEIRFGLFFPMELVFERFVYATLKDLARERILASVSYQANPYGLLSRQIEDVTRQSFNLRPDLTITTQDGQRWILDALRGSF